MLLIFNFLYIMFVFLFLCIYTNPATGCYMNKTILCVREREEREGEGKERAMSPPHYLDEVYAYGTSP